MTHAVNIPKLGLTMEEATLVEWHYPDRAHVTKGTPLFTIETDKISSEIEAEHDGFLQQAAMVDAVLPVGALVGYLHAQATDEAGPLGSKSAMPVERGSSVPDVAVVGVQLEPPPRHAASLADSDGQRLLISPVARQIATKRQVDLKHLRGSGPGGVILRRDVEAAPGAPAATGNVPTAVVEDGVAARRPLSGMRKAVARRMMDSLSGSAQMTGFGKIDMTEVVGVRGELVAAASTLGARITYTDIVLKACAQALREMPEINASIVGDEIVTWSAVNIGLAVSVDDGLLVPVLKRVDELNLIEISRLRQDLIDKARSRTLERSDIEGGTFTLSNFGSYGGDFETPILSPPQSALLGIGQIAEEAAVRNGQIVIRSAMMMSLTFDHRLIDGALAGRFRARIRALLEQPSLLLALLR
ncbi:dihydrolipoamide acetyltransferase family protein [Bosea sp. (in: a-proteobacteria)]|uniref:dihydrolipoamide acetyltransferase family protein n=1 Tax=Bosea sp. (in: a-proteobacteria) TaxID=1871050 RepID=UPI003B3AE724